jgi:predicted MFS family arabinose efflux permease
MTFAVLMCFVGYLLRINLSIAGPTMIRDLGLSDIQLGLVFLVGVLLVAPLMILASGAETPIAVVALLSTAFGLIELTDAVYWVAAMRVAGPRTAAATGLMNTGANVAIGAGSLVIPVIAHAFGWPAAVASGAVLAVLSAGCWLWIAADRALDQPAAQPAPLPA